jgi:hypothetical protein
VSRLYLMAGGAQSEERGGGISAVIKEENEVAGGRPRRIPALKRGANVRMTVTPGFIPGISRTLLPSHATPAPRNLTSAESRVPHPRAEARG